MSLVPDRDRARLLYVTRVYPYRPAFGGEISYSRGVIESLADACDLTVIAATNGILPLGRQRHDGVLWHLVAPVHRWRPLSLLSPVPLLPWRHASRDYHRLLAQLLGEDWDGVVLDHFASAHTLPLLERWKRSQPGRRLMYLAHEHEATTRREKYALYAGNPIRQLAMRIDGWKIARWEKAILRTVDFVSLINANERPLFEASVANGHYITTTPGYDGPRVAVRRIDATTPRRVAVLGGRGSLHKQHILDQWLAVAADRLMRAGIEINVIGDIGHDLRLAMARRYPHVRFSGFVDDLTEHLQQVRIGIVPDTVGRGVKIRLASYIFARVPMAGYRGAIDGLPIRAPHDFIEAPSLRALAEQVVAAIDDFDRLNRLQNNAFAACTGALDWPAKGVAIVSALRSNAKTDPIRPSIDRVVSPAQGATA